MTRLLYAAMIVTCICALSGAALAADGWTVTAQDLPAAIEWDASVPASVEAHNSGTTDWGDTFALTSVEVPTSTAVPIDRWGLESVPVEGVTVAPDGSYLFEFPVVGPPITTMLYPLPLTPTAAAAPDALDCSWILANGSTLITTDIAAQHTVVSRFKDTQPGTSGAWAWFWIEECAGRVPLIVTGYQQPDGSYLYQPTWEVDRAAMAVYMARALNLPTAAYEGLFPDDVASDHWAWPWIEALQRAGIVQGFDATHYGPSMIVNRDAMAVYVARGMVGGMEVPTGPPTPSFPMDVPTSQWAYDEIEYCAAHNVVQGIGGGYYLPSNAVTRGQMAVFVYKGFIMPTGAVVVLGGPAISQIWTDYSWAWTSLASFPQDDPGIAYVVLDCARLNTDMAPLELKFELVGPETTTEWWSVDATEIQWCIDEVNAYGYADVALGWYIPTGLAPGDYIFVMTIGGNVLARQPAFEVTE